MADIKTPVERSRNMSAIKGKNTGPEVYIRKLLFARGYRYRKNVSGIPGHPDIWLKKYHTAVFVNGCFWHRHAGCKYAYFPKSRTEFWQKKFDANVKRDSVIMETLSVQHIRTLVIWECTVRKMRKDKSYEAQIIESCVAFFQNSTPYLEL